MDRVYNFSPGPAMLPQTVLEQMQRELLNWQGMGTSVMEVSHRSKVFMQMTADCDSLMRKLLNIPNNYRILFLPGGATLQFSGVPLNILSAGKKAGYIVTGVWSEKAMQAARAYGTVDVIAESSEQAGLSCLPELDSAKVSDEYAYIYYTSNETINGLQFQSIPLETRVPLVCDMTSSLMSEPLEINRYGIIFASAQKNLGQSGITVVIVRDDLVGQAQPITPAVIDYAQQIEQNSMLNTPPTFAWYSCYLMLQWIDSQGGVAAMHKATKAKAERMYACIDRHPLYHAVAEPKSRSLLNMPFRFSEPKLEAEFLAEADQHGLINLKGHRIVGGIRPSVYIGMPMAGVVHLTEFMDDFAARKG